MFTCCVLACVCVCVCVSVCERVAHSGSFTVLLFFYYQGKEFYNTKFLGFCKSKNIIVYSSTTDLKAFNIEITNGIIKRIVSRKLQFYQSKNWTSVIDDAVAIYNKTKSPSLNNLSPEESLHPDGIADLQSFYLKKRAKR